MSLHGSVMSYSFRGRIFLILYIQSFFNRFCDLMMEFDLKGHLTSLGFKFYLFPQAGKCHLVFCLRFVSSMAFRCLTTAVG